MRMNIADCGAVVAGGASGLGAATVEALVAQDAFVTILDVRVDQGEALCVELGTRVRFVRTDVTNEEDVINAIEIAAKIAPLRVAVNCAGIADAARTVTREGIPAPVSMFRKVLDVNLVGTFMVASRAASEMAKTEVMTDGERGVIVNTSSGAAYEGQIGQVAYSASKAGVAGLTLPMARDLASMGIRVCAIAPGLMDTAMLASLNADVRSSLAAEVPFPHRLGSAHEYSSLVLEIIRNSYLNGEVIRLDGALRLSAGRNL